MPIPFIEGDLKVEQLEDFFKRKKDYVGISKVLLPVLRKELSVSDLVEKLRKGNRQLADQFFDLAIELGSNRLEDFEYKKNLLDEIQWFQRSKEYNNYAPERLWALFQALFKEKT
jgi:hypothetical protein